MEEGTSMKVETIQSLATSLDELKIEKASISSTTNNQSKSHGEVHENLICKDEIWGDDSDNDSNHASSGLNREWNWRHNQFHTMGYRDGITEGKEFSAQEGFNIGFKQSVKVGYKWGLVRGISSTLSSLPDSLRKKLVPDFETRKQIGDLYNSVQAISSEDSIKMYHESLVENGLMQSIDCVDHSEKIFRANKDMGKNKFENHYKEFIHLLHETPEIKIGGELRCDMEKRTLP